MKEFLFKIKAIVVFKLTLVTIAIALIISVFNPIWANTDKLEVITLSEQDRTALLKSISKKVMLPIFRELNVSSIELLEQTKSFCNSKSESSLIDLRKAWGKASDSWHQTDSLLLGPSVDDNIDFTVYFLPIKKGIIKSLLDKDDIQLKDVDSAGVGAQGFGALEYLLFSREQSLVEIKESFVKQPNRCNYLVKATELLHQNISTISRQWKHYGVQFGLAGNSSLYFLESKVAMNLLVNKIFQSAQKISLKKVAILSNKEEIKRSAPYKLQAWRSGSSLRQLKANVRGIKRLLEDGQVFNWMKKKNKKEKAVEDIAKVIEGILDFNVINEDLFTALKNSPNEFKSLVKNSQKLTELIKTQIAPSMSVELGFNDNDGD